MTDRLQFSEKDSDNYYESIEEEIYALTDTVHVNSENPYEDKTYVRLADVIMIIEQHKANKASELKETYNMIEKGVLKQRGEGYVYYDINWLKKWWRPEMEMLGINTWE